MVNNSKMEEDCDDKDDTKRKSRNLSEKKRRDQFNSLVNDLSALISTTNRKMDKSTVLKSTIAFLKHHNEATDRSKVFEIQQDWKPSFLTNDEFTHLMLESLDGFIIVFSSRGTIYYASESVTSLLGYLPSDILNRSIYDLTYAKDHESLFNIFLNPKPVIEQLQTDINASNQITFFLYLKRGGCDSSKDATFYELVKFVGYFRNNVNLENLPAHNTQQPAAEIFRSKSLTDLDSKLVFVGTGRIQKPQLTREMCAVDPLRSEFTSKHSMEWKFLFLDQRAPPIIGYMPFEVLGTSGYDYYHFDDLDNIVECHEKLMQNGEGKSCFYRFLTKGQQWIWLQTDYYISYHQYNSKPDYVMCNHRVVSYADVRNESKEAADSLALSHPQQAEEELGGVKVPQRKEFDNSATGPFDASPVLAASGEAVAAVGPLNVGVGLMGDGSPSALETSNIWAELSSTATTPMTPPQKPSRPASSFGYISPGISPKRSKYLKPSRGNESDSTSISAESGTSRHSLLTHPSSGRQRHNSLGNMPHQSHQSKHMNSRHLNTQPNPGQAHGSSQQMTLHPLISPTPMQLLDPSATHQQRGLGNASGSGSGAAAMPLTSGGPGTSQQKVPIPMLAQPAVASSPLLPTSTCQYSQAPFPLRSSQIVGSGFLEPPQYLAAIPVQPVISTFPVTPVLSPLPVSSATFAGHRLQPLQHDSSPPDMIPAGVVMSPGQNQLQDRLQRRHDELQQIVMQKQDELRIVSEQLLLARYTYLQPVLPYNGLTTSPPQPNGRPHQSNSSNNSNNNNTNNTNNTNEPQFNQYGFALNSAQIQNQHDQAMIMQQQQTLTQQQHQPTNVPHPHQQQQQQQQQTLQQNSQAAGPSSGQQDVGVMQQSPASQLTHLMDPGANLQQQQQQQTVPPPPNSNDFDQFAGDDMDVFFNLSPLQSMTSNHLNSLAALSRAAGAQSAADVNNVDASGDMGMVGGHNNNNNNNSADDRPYVGGLDGRMGPPGAEDLPPIGEDNGMPVGVANEDPILSYMQLASQNQFAMAISEEDSETQGEETKVLQDRLHQQQQQHHQHQQQQQQQHQLQHQQHAAQHQQQQHANQHQQQQQQSQSQQQQHHHHDQQQHHHDQQHHQQQQQEQPSQRSYYTGNPFDNSEMGGSDSIPNDLEILQYQMSQEQSQNLFNSSAPSR